MTDSQPGYEFRFLHAEHIPQILALQDLVIENLTDKENYYKESIDYFQETLIGEESSLGIFMQGQLIGYNLVSFPKMKAHNLGLDAGLHEKDLLKVAHWGPAAIHPAFQRQGLLKNIITRQLHKLTNKGYEHILLTVAPRNYPSLRFVLQQGFLIKQLKLKYGNLLRYVLHLNIKHPISNPVCRVSVSGADLDSQQFMLNLGFYGYAVREGQNGVELLFGHDGFSGQILTRHTGKGG
ncbi:hypothetical protein P22_2035 [Propionispora sp. 2/2-37]|uniref:GNAT family N-acetyltransferase n=1 Tax=Propionispora sp. 2/2-37 TaxID=1677858 RepID=UPI0006BB791C|nr:GNAT family N-acetyltransferase [Propionispora sp. 2/2-37]CUH95947.1 hypothetical protein P22_2035 [Propionispora sp. 2/2-37]